MKNSRLASQGNVLPTVVAIVALVLVVVGVGILLLTGALKVNNGNTVAQQSSLCKDAISIQNSAYSAPSAEEYAAKLSESAQAASQVSGNQSDPDCVFVQFTNALYTKDATNIDKFSKQLRTLYDDGKYISGRLTYPLGIKDIEDAAKSTVTPANGDSSAGAPGNG
jgi:hypothetical protein